MLLCDTLTKAEKIVEREIELACPRKIHSAKAGYCISSQTAQRN